MIENARRPGLVPIVTIFRPHLETVSRRTKERKSNRLGGLFFQFFISISIVMKHTFFISFPPGYKSTGIVEKNKRIYKGKKLFLLL